MDSASDLRATARLLWADAHVEIDLALRVAVLLPFGHPREQVAQALDVELRDVTRVIKRLQSIAHRIDRDA